MPSEDGGTPPNVAPHPLSRASSSVEGARSYPSLKSPVSTLEVYAARLPSTSVTSFCGAMAGVASGIVTCPLDVIKTKLQAQGGFRSRQRRVGPSPSTLYSGMVGTARVIWNQDGLRGMYRGLGPMLLGYLPTWAVYMGVYERSKEYYYTKIGRFYFLFTTDTRS